MHVTAHFQEATTSTGCRFGFAEDTEGGCLQLRLEDISCRRAVDVSHSLVKERISSLATQTDPTVTGMCVIPL